MKFNEKENYNVCNTIHKNFKDAHSYPNTNLVRLDKWFLKKKISNKLLDYGCGYGENSIYYAKAGYKVYAADVSKNLISYVKKRTKTKTKKKISFFHINEKLKKLPFKDNYFDTIICAGVIMYLGSKSKTQFVLNEFERCLKPNGKFIISTFGPQNTFIKRSKKINKNTYIFKGVEKFHVPILLKHTFYIPYSAKNFKSWFPKKLNVQEVGSWSNIYCGINGFHYAAIGNKVE